MAISSGLGRAVVAGLLAVAASWMGAGQARAADEKEFYKGKTVTIIVSTKAGGGYDAYGRLLAKTLPKYLPGITAVVKNVPGAGHIIGCNEIYRAKPDGLTFGTFNKGLITSQLVAMDGVKFDLHKMSWLGSPATEGRAFIISTKKPWKSIEDLKKAKEQIVLCSAGVGSESHNDAVMLAEILDIEKNVKIVPGYAGTEGDMAMMRGEVHGQIGAIDSMKPMIDQGEARPILIIANQKSKAFPNLPLITDYAKAGKEKSMAELMVAEAMLTRPFAGPPGIPPERLKVLREAYDAAWKDPDLLLMAKKMGVEISPQDADSVARAVNAALNQPSDMVDFLKKTVKASD